MKCKPTYHQLIYLFFMTFFSIGFQSQTMTITGNNWAPSIPSITEAGNNYAGTYESATNQIILAVSVPAVLGSGKVSVHYEANPMWHSSLILSGRRTNNGTTTCVLCSITGGTAYQTITQTDLELFRIQAVLALGAYTGINIQLQLGGVSVAIPAATYSSRIVFTVGP